MLKHHTPRHRADGASQIDIIHDGLPLLNEIIMGGVYHFRHAARLAVVAAMLSPVYISNENVQLQTSDQQAHHDAQRNAGPN